MTAQLRIYDIKPGMMKLFVELFRTEIEPIRRQYGFTIVGPWVHDDHNQFVWVVGYEGPLGWDEAVDQYVNSPERASISVDPMTMIDAIDARILRPV